MSKLIPVVASALLMGSAGASAAVFDLSSPSSSIDSSVTVMAGGVTLTVTPLAGDAIHRNSNGVGYIDASGDNDFRLDGRGGVTETLSFSFDQDVTINSINFRSFGGNDDATFGGSLSALGVYSGPSTYSGVGASIAAGQTFTISATQGNDRFRIFSIDAASAVPVPAAAWLFGSALAGIIGLRRRKS